MMVVNASNSPGLFYQQTISGLCENTLYEFSADIINLIKVGTLNHIDSDVSFLLDGVELFSTGNIPKTNNWTTYGFTFMTVLGQQSLTLSLRNNGPGGNGNDLAIDNISFRACGPEISITPTTVINLCEGDSPTELQSTIIGTQYVNPTFQWQQSFDQGGTWINIAGATEENYTPAQLIAGLNYYRFLVADGIANLSSDKCRVNSSPKIINLRPSAIIQMDTLLCQGQTLMVGSSIYSESGIYMDTFTNFLGCDSILITDLTVTINSNFVADLLATPPCPNLANGSISIENVSGATPPFNYIFEGIEVGNTSLFTDLAGGQTYSIIIQDDNGCSTEESVLIEDTPDIILDLGEDQIIELGETVQISSFYNFIPSEFNWQPLAPIDCLDFADCDELDFLPTTSQQVTLDLFVNAGCSISDSIFIEVIDLRKVWFPNAFSPNSDGINDFFTVFGKTPNIKIIEEFRIFNRWGALVFENKDFLPNILQKGWDGTFNGEPMSPGVYIYTATVQFVDEQVLQYSGDVSIMK